MHETLIDNWNSVVGVNDEVIHAGDYAYTGSLNDAQNIRARLNGKIHLILGNHDKLAKAMPRAWESISDIKEINISGQGIVICHYPMRTWHWSYRGYIHLFGHCHGELPSYGKSFDIGVDSWNYTPISFQQVINHAATLENIHVIPEERKWNKSEGK
jgi:calcineurin-like phosphoesterase family protein